MDAWRGAEVKRLGNVIASLGWFAGLAVIAYLIWFEPPWLSYQSLPFRVVTPIVSPGDTVLLEVGRCSTASTVRVYGISHTLRNTATGETTVLPATSSAIRPGCKTVPSATNTVPINTSPGIYVVDGYAEVPGTVRTSLVHWYSETFEVR